MKYLNGTKNYMFVYKRTDNLEVVNYSDSNFVGSVDSQKSTSRYIFMMADEAISKRSASKL